MRGRSVRTSSSTTTVAIANAVQPVVEQLERRQLLDATLVDGVITITGSSAVDIVIVSVDPLNSRSVLVQLNDATGQSFALEDTTGILIDVFEGNDRIAFDPVRGHVLLPTTIRGGAGNDRIDA